MENNANIFKHQEFFIIYNNSIIKFTVCKTNKEIIIKSNNYEVIMNHQNLEDLMETKFDNLEKEYIYFLNLFQLNSIKIKDIIINESITISFSQNGKTKELILLYNNQSKSITHYELNVEFKNLISDISQIKKDVQEIHQAIHNNNVNQNQNQILRNKIFDFYLGFPEFQKVKNNIIENTISMLDKQIIKQEKFLEEYKKRIDGYQELAKNELKQGNKEKAQNLLTKKKKALENMRCFEGILDFIDEQKMALENTFQMQDLMKTIRNGNKAIVQLYEDLSEEDQEQPKIYNTKINNLNKELKIKKDGLGEKQELDDDTKEINQYKKEGYEAIKKGIIANIFLNDEFNSEEVKKIQNTLDNLEKKNDDFFKFFRAYAENS